MAFTTEFVMGAGGAEVEEIPVSMSGGGAGNVYPLTTVDAGAGAWVWVEGEKVGNSACTLTVGGKSYAGASAPTRAGGGGYFIGNVACSVTTIGFSNVTFSGKVYVTRM